MLGNFNRHVDALPRYLVEHAGEDMDLSQDDVEVDHILPVIASSCSLKSQAAVPQAGAAEIHIQEEWALIQQIPTSCRYNTFCRNSTSCPTKNAKHCPKQ